MNFTLHRIASPIGTILLVTDVEERVRAADFEGYEEHMHSLLRKHYGSYELSDAIRPTPVEHQLNRYFAGELDALSEAAVCTNGSEFDRRVWTALRQIPAGSVTTYGRLAAELGNAAGARRVGGANAANPIGIIVPCHRVIGKDGDLKGFAWGLERKEWLLSHEKATVNDEPSLRLPGF
jgi:methylated-DNA-[protein]-cysteine S-methyltransferase